jgi:hypothetical protein
MAEDVTRKSEADAATIPVGMDDPLPSTDDPGGAHSKGFSADPRPESEIPEKGPIPLADPPEDTSAVKVPERDNHVVPTGRNEPGEYTPNDRLIGSDR